MSESHPSRGTALITTGFFILSAQAPETDGPLGAIAMAKALSDLGFEVVFVTDKHTMPILAMDGANMSKCIEFPITDHEASRKFAQNLLAEVKPSILIAIERCGFADGLRYFNMRGRDISDYTAKIDYLFLGQGNTIGIGDGGNEIGMGNFARQIRTLPNLPSNPTLTTVSKLIIASVSNWGAYGLVTALSQLCKRNLLPSVEWEKEMLREVVARGAVDGVSGERRCAVDNFDAEQNAWALTHLNELLRKDTHP